MFINSDCLDLVQHLHNWFLECIFICPTQANVIQSCHLLHEFVRSDFSKDCCGVAACAWCLRRRGQDCPVVGINAKTPTLTGNAIVKLKANVFSDKVMRASRCIFLTDHTYLLDPHSQ